MKFEIESMENMCSRLRGTGGGEAAAAVAKAIKTIEPHGGRLDSMNRAAVLVHLAVALAGKEYAASALLDAAAIVEGAEPPHRARFDMQESINRSEMACRVGDDRAAAFYKIRASRIARALGLPG